MAERGTGDGMTDDEFWALLREKQSRYRRPPLPRGEGGEAAVEQIA